MIKKLTLLLLFCVFFTGSCSSNSNQEEFENLLVTVRSGNGSAESHTDATNTPSSAPSQMPTQNSAEQGPAPIPTEIPFHMTELIESLTGLPFDEFVESAYIQLRLRDPDAIYMNGFADVYGLAPGEDFTDISYEYLWETYQLESRILELLHAYDRNALTAEQKITYDSFEKYLDIHVRGYAYSDYKIIVSPVWGVQNYPIDFLIALPIETKQDAEMLIARLSSLDIWADQVIDWMIRNENVGAIPPKYVIEDTIAQIDDILAISGSYPPYVNQIVDYLGYREKILDSDDISQEDKDNLLEAALWRLRKLSFLLTRR